MMALAGTRGLAFRKLAVELAIQSLQEKSTRERCQAVSHGVLNGLLPGAL